jgi:hypothetical protein
MVTTLQKKLYHVKLRNKGYSSCTEMALMIFPSYSGKPVENPLLRGFHPSSIFTFMVTAQFLSRKKTLVLQ